MSQHKIVDIEKFEDFHLCGAGDPISMPVAIGFSLQRGRGGTITCVLVM